jgi:hypothetical protein
MRRRHAYRTDILCRAAGIPGARGLVSAVLLLGAPTAVGCGDPDAGGLPSTLPRIEDAELSDPTIIDHPLHPLLPGFARVYFEQTADGPAVEVAQALDETREVARVESRVVLDRVYLDGLLVESAHGWFAQDDDGNVWTMGREVERYEHDDDGNVIDTNPEGAWEAGQDVAGLGVEAHAGWLIPADPRPGDVYHQEYYPDVAEDMVEVLALDVDVTLFDGSTYSTLQTRDHTPLDPDAEEHVYYAEGLGKVLGEHLVDEERLDLVGTFRPGPVSVPSFATASFAAPTTIDHPYFPLVPGTIRRYEGRTEDGLEVTEIEVLAETRVVSGIECVVVRDTVTVGGLLVEDTRDWFAQDDDGNVWYMGEEVDDYAYDEQGNMLEVTHEGSWEAGLDVAGLGVIAAPGHQMPQEPVAKASYHQEWYEGAADDMAYVVATGVRAELPDGTVYEDCVQTLDWAPLEPSALEHKYYAPGVGLVMEVPLDAVEETVVLVSG